MKTDIAMSQNTYAICLKKWRRKNEQLSHNKCAAVFLDECLTGQNLRSRQQRSQKADPHTERLTLHWVSKTCTSGLVQTHTGPLDQWKQEVDDLKRDKKHTGVTNEEQLQGLCSYYCVSDQSNWAKWVWFGLD